VWTRGRSGGTRQAGSSLCSTVAVAIAAALRVPLAELAGLSAEPAAGPGRVLPHVRHGIEFSVRDDSNGELRVTGDDDAAVLLWAAAWLDEHRDWTVTCITFRYPAWPGHEGTTATVVFELASPGTPSADDMRPRLGPWPHGVPPDARVKRPSGSPWASETAEFQLPSGSSSPPWLGHYRILRLANTR
jgi:hypothetical protein